MITLAQRIEALRTERGLSRPALAAALSLPKLSVEKFETGRQSPTKEQVQLLADFFGVSTFYLRGESNDRTRQDTWLENMDSEAEGEHVPATAPKRKAAPSPSSGEGSIFNALIQSSSYREMIRDVLWEVLSSKAGQDLIAKAVQREVNRRGEKA